MRQDGAVPGPAHGHAAAARDLYLVCIQIEDDGGVLVDAENRGAVRQFVLQQRQAALAEVAVPRVMGTALSVVVVRNERAPQAEQAQQVQAVQPVWSGARLVDLIDR